MNVMHILLGKLKKGDILRTPSQGKEFKIGDISNTNITLVLGEKGTKTLIPSKCWNGIPSFLKGKDWVEIGAVHSVISKPGTLEEYINENKPERRSTANYVAAVLKRVGIVEIDRSRPSKARLL